MLSHKPKVLFFVSPFFGGASRMTITIAKLLDSSKYDIKFIVYGQKIQEIRNYIPEDYSVQLLKIKSIWHFMIWKLVGLFRKERPDIVFCSFRIINARIAVAAKIVGGIKLIFRNDNGIYALKPHDRIFVKFTYPAADVVITQQEEMQEELEKFLPCLKGRVVTLHNYLDTEMVDKNLTAENPYRDNNSIKFVFCGRIHPIKGIDTLLKAFTTVKKSIPDAQLYLLGKYNEGKENIEYYNLLNDYIIINHLEDAVHFEGLQANPHIWVRHANCFVLPSRREGLPNALIEAMYIGTPVVAATCIPVINRMVDEGQNGYVVPVDDDETMAEAMLKAIDLKECKMTYKPASADDFRKLFEFIES